MTTRHDRANPWQADESLYPSNGSVEEQASFCLSYAVLAPSIHNTQPWFFRVGEKCVELLADTDRKLPVVDPDGRQLTISCGAALMNLIAALHHFGHQGWVQYLPDRDNPNLLARVRIGRTHVPDYHDESLFRAIRRRRTTRLPFRPRPIPRALQRRLIWLASEYNCWLHFIEDTADRQRTLELITEGDRQQLGDPEFRTELADWIKPEAGERREGMSAYAFGLSELLDFSTPLLSATVRTFDIGRGRAARDRELLEASPTLVVLGTQADNTADWLNAGQAMEQMLLRAAAEDVTASFLNQPCEISDLRKRLQDVTGRSGPPQLLMRFGYAPVRHPSPRRPVSEVILNHR